MTLKNRYFLLRHGQTVWQKTGLSYPWPHHEKARLDQKGKSDIQKVAKKLKDKKIDQIFSSDLCRTKETAGIVAKILGSKIVFDKRLRDTNISIYHGRPKEIFNRDFPLSKLMTRFKKRPKGGENWNEVRRRVKSFLAENENEKRYRSKNILIVSHGDPLWLLEGLMKKLSNQDLVNIILTKKQIKMGELREI